MKKNQGSLEIEAAEGGGEIHITISGKQVSLGVMISALKDKLKVYGIKHLGDRDLTLTLEIPPQPEEAEPQ